MPTQKRKAKKTTCERPTVLSQNLSTALRNELSWFLNHIDSLAISIGPLMKLLAELSEELSKERDSFEKTHCKFGQEKKIDDAIIKEIKIPYEKHMEWKKMIRRESGFSVSHKLIPRSVFVSFVSIYDAYIGKLLRILFLIKPEVLNTSDKKFLFSDLVLFSNIEEARESIINKEIENVLRKSHSEQLKYINNTFSIKINPRKELLEKFIELTERRNLFVHCDGIVSSQYVAACNNHGIEIDSKGIGTTLGINARYLKGSYDVLYEMAVQMTHVLWRKFFPTDLESADKNLIDITFDLLCIGKYKLAQNLLRFSCEKYIAHHDDINRHIFIINHALSFHLDTMDKECKEILSQHDWTAKADEFRLANFVLNKDWKGAVEIMVKIGNDQKWMTHYRDWPLFTNFRETKFFLNNYKKIFGKNFKDESATENITSDRAITQ